MELQPQRIRSISQLQLSVYLKDFKGRMAMSGVFAGCGFLVFFFSFGFAQSTFEVASIKPSDPSTRGVQFRVAPGGLNISGATVKLLIQEAYDVRESQISGGPGWISSDRYDIMAKAESDPSLRPDSQSTPSPNQVIEQQRQRLRALLADRFRLKIHREMKELPVYALVPAKSGPRVQESKPADAAVIPGKEPPHPPGAMIRLGRGQISGQSVSLDLLARTLSQQLGRMVVDKTGLQGSYDFTLDWTPDAAQGPGPSFGNPGEPAIGNPSPTPAPAEPGGPSLFVALQEQLGLRLESQKAPVETIVIESVDRPSEN